MKKKFHALTLGAALLLTVSMTQAADFQWVDRDGVGGSSSGGWDALQTALNSAQAGTTFTQGYLKISGDVIRTAGDATQAQLNVTAGVHVSGGWNSGFTTQSGRSQINADSLGLGTNIRVFDVSAANVTMESLEVTGGRIVGDNQWGAGIYAHGAVSSFTADNLYVHDNASVNPGYQKGGGGMAIRGTGTVTGVRITDSIISNNTSSGGNRGSGGGLYLHSIGTAASPVIIDYTTLDSNLAGGSPGYDTAGGAIYANNAYAVVANSKLTNNTGNNGGTAVVTYSSTMTVFGSLIAGNHKDGSPGTGVATLYDQQSIGGRGIRLVNSTVADNYEGGLEDAGVGNVWPITQPRMTVINSIVHEPNVTVGGPSGTNPHAAHMDFQYSTITADNYTYRYLGTTYADAADNLDDALDLMDPASQYRFHSLDFGGTLTQQMEGNLQAAAAFVGGGTDPYAQASGSNSIDNAAYVQSTFSFIDVNFNSTYDAMTDIIIDGTPPVGQHLAYLTDLAGNARVLGAWLDRGAYEVSGAPVPEPATLALLGLGGLALAGARRRRAA